VSTKKISKNQHRTNVREQGQEYLDILMNEEKFYVFGTCLCFFIIVQNLNIWFFRS